jgi:pyridoxamine 5'-phosphate oxidase
LPFPCFKALLIFFKIWGKILFVQGPSKLPRPANWGGYRVIPVSFEFWQGQSSRIHDRIRFRRKLDPTEVPDPKVSVEGENGWIIERLSP